MLHHVVWWTLKEEAEGYSAQENGERLVKLGNALKEQIDELVSINLSMKIMPTTTVDAKLVLHSTHKNAEDLAKYSAHPAHIAFGVQLKPCVSSRQAIDFEE